MLLNAFRALVAAAGLVVAVPQLVWGQAVPDPSDPFFDGTALQDIFRTINSRDWAGLNEHFLASTYYAANVKWNSQTVRRKDTYMLCSMTAPVLL